MTSSRHRLTRLLPALAVAIAALLWSSPGAPASLPTERLGERGGAVRDYWTPERMRSAEPVEVDPAALLPAPEAASGSDSEPSYVPAAGPAVLREGAEGDGAERRIGGVRRDEIRRPGAPAFRMHGKVFFTVEQEGLEQDFVCSGTAVNSRNRSLVWTVGHCVFDSGPSEEGFTNRFVSNFIFVPGYRNGAAPFGEWPARRLVTTKQFARSGNLKYDLGAAVVRTNSAGRRLQGVVGARGIGFDQPRDVTYRAYGYPAQPPPLEFDGEREFRCTGRPGGVDNSGGPGPATNWIPCDMTPGSSGGGWIGPGSTLLSVTSYGYPLRPDELYGPYQSRVAKKVYREARGGKKRGGKRG